MSTSARYLSKSRFKLALECVTKLYYTGKKKQYADESLNDPFLKTLAEGGFQVGEIAKYLFCEDPVADGITIDSLDYKVSLDETEKRLNLPGKVVIAEAAFLFRNLFIRADIVVKEGKTIDLYEVKAKSIEGEESFSEDKFLSFKGKENESISANWQEYFYDLAFQKYVITQSLTGYDVRAHLLLTDKDAVATIDGLNQKFKITREKERTGIIVETGLKASSLGNIPLRTINLDKIIDKIWNVYDVPSAYRRGIKFLEFIALCEDVYLKDNRQFEKIGSKCKGCQFYAEPVNADGLKSGFHECWKNHTNYSDELLSKPHVIDLWGGRTNKYIEENIFLLENINENEILEKEKKDIQPAHGLSAAERKAEQILRARSGTTESFFDKEGITNEINKWTWPLHMIDFETSMVALPFYKNTKPYQGIAFQFSQHLLHKDGRVEHTHQYLNLTQGFYPNVEFVKTLKKSLAGDNGTIFRYSNHENTYLQMISRQINDGTAKVDNSERDELIEFINSITRYKSDNKTKWIEGSRNMIDLLELVKRYYYSPGTGGSNSLKQVLPAIIRDSKFLLEKYSKPGAYGKNLPVKSLNFDDHVWIQKEKKNDPYKTLPPVFDGMERETLDNLVNNFEGLADGGAAITAYSYLQYSHVPDDQKLMIADALYRYCELDTLAMVMLVEGWMNWGEKNKNL